MPILCEFSISSGLHPLKKTLWSWYPVFVSAFPLNLNSTPLTKVSESIPLRATLGIEFHFIIIDRPWLFILNLMFELCSPKPRHFRLIQSPIRAYSHTVHYLFACGDGRLRCEAIQHSKFISGAIETPRVAPRSIFLERKGGEGRCFCLAGHFLI